MEQVVACALVTQRARVRSPVGTGFLGEVFSGFSSPVRQMSGNFRPPRSPNIIWPSQSSFHIRLVGTTESECVLGVFVYSDLPDNKKKFNTYIKSLSVLPRRGE